MKAASQRGLAFAAAALVTLAAMACRRLSAVHGVKLLCVPISNSSLGATCAPDIRSILQDVDQLGAPPYRAAMEGALSEHGMLLFRDQHGLSPAEELRLMKLAPWDPHARPEKSFGPLGTPGIDREHYARWRLPQQPELLCQGEGDVVDHHGLSGHLSSGKPVKEWHTDGLHELDTPPVSTSMYSISVKPVGGDTLFMSGRIIYDSLEPSEQARVDGMRVAYRRTPAPMHESGLRARLPKDEDASGSLSLGPLYELAGKGLPNTSQTHPLVWVHPTTRRKSLMVAPMWVSHLVEADGAVVPFEAAQRLIGEWLRLGEATRYSHRWRAGDFVLWDNRQLLHSATPNSGFSKGGLRLLHRIRLSGPYAPKGPLAVSSE